LIIRIASVIGPSNSRGTCVGEDGVKPQTIIAGRDRKNAIASALPLILAAI
jgi:hypothetical protein